MIPAAAFIEHLRELGYSQYAGVPCSYLKPFINYVIDDPTLDYLGAASEGEAVGITLGAHFAGRKTVTMCQNSGLGNMVNPLTSLNHPFRVPTLLITTWRGEPGVPDEPQHEQMGQITHRLLETLDIPWHPFPTDEAAIAPTMDEAETHMAKHSRPFALVMSKDSVAKHTLQTQPTSVVTTCEAKNLLNTNSERLTRTAALELTLETLNGDEALIATTGKTGRELFTLADRPGHVYVVGGMGCASAIGLGIAHDRPRQPVVVLDGDGAVLMKMGALATIGHIQPANLLHIVLDNEAHDSTGGQATVSPTTRFAEVAAAANYRHAHAVTSAGDFCNSLKELRNTDGPSLIHVKIQPGAPATLGRPSIKPHEVRDRITEFLRSNDS